VKSVSQKNKSAVETHVSVIYYYSAFYRTPWYKSEDESNIPPVPRTSASKHGQNFRRIAVLNKLFMRHITDMMASGEVANEILGRGMEISRV